MFLSFKAIQVPCVGVCYIGWMGAVLYEECWLCGVLPPKCCIASKCWSEMRTCVDFIDNLAAEVTIVEVQEDDEKADAEGGHCVSNRPGI